MAADRPAVVWPTMKAQIEAADAADREEQQLQAWLDAIELGGPFDDLDVAGAGLEHLQRVMGQATDRWKAGLSPKRPTGSLDLLLSALSAEFCRRRTSGHL